MTWFASLQSALGLAAIIGIAWALSENRRAVPSWRWIAGAVLLQIVVAVAVLRIPVIWDALRVANAGVAVLEASSRAGSSYMFGYLGGAEPPFVLKPGATAPVIIAFQILPLVIFTSALAALLWHWGVLRLIVRALSWALQRTLGIGGAVGLNAGANVFLGVVEAPLIVRAYLARMTRAELFMVMTLGMSTVSGVVLILYSQTLARVVDNSFGHVITASLVCLPASLLLARLMVPGESPTGADRKEDELRYDSSIDALVRGTFDGLQLFLAVIAILLVVFALVALANYMLGALPPVADQPLTVQRLFGWVFAPLMWLIGVPWAEAIDAGALMGTKAILNEYVAYQQLATDYAGRLSPRSTLIVTYALCGFANLASVGLSVSTLTTLAPERRKEILSLGFKSWISGNLATAMIGAVIGLITF
ncbi:MAG TPA: nucleoside transporter C-terminal domain-containing protein [Steroidobacteraceae bacterium]|nr:nucleoside transporter C-terminal domain-containing protein [Steroidobacteraceae bacterium]